MYKEWKYLKYPDPAYLDCDEDCDGCCCLSDHEEIVQGPPQQLTAWLTGARIIGKLAQMVHHKARGEMDLALKMTYPEQRITAMAERDRPFFNLLSGINRTTDPEKLADKRMIPVTYNYVQDLLSKI